MEKQLLRKASLSHSELLFPVLSYRRGDPMDLEIPTLEIWKLQTR